MEANTINMAGGSFDASFPLSFASREDFINAMMNIHYKHYGEERRRELLGAVYDIAANIKDKKTANNGHQEQSEGHPQGQPDTPEAETINPETAEGVLPDQGEPSSTEDQQVN